MKGRRSTVSVARRLTVAAVVSVALVVALLCAGWSGLAASQRAAVSLERLTTAQSRHQDLDMAHDAIHALVAGGALDGEHGDIAGVQRKVDGLALLADDVDKVFLEQGRIVLPRNITDQLAVAANQMDKYLRQASVVLANATRGPAQFSADAYGAFETTSEDLELLLGGITDRFVEEAASARADAATARHNAFVVMMITAGIAAVIVVTSAWQIRRSITRSLAGVGAVAARVAAGDFDARSDELGDDELGRLGHEFNRVADSLQEMVGRLRQDAERSAFGKELGSAFEMVDTEAEVYRASQRAMTTAAGASKVELLLADSSQAHLEQAAVHPDHGGPGCSVQSPFGCAAVRRGATVVFRTSAALDACPKLVDREGGPYAAVCAPVSFMGKALGVLHTTRPVDQPFTQEQVDRIGTLATGVGTRIGTVRAFEKTQIQASTDGMTGLMNRRSMEERIGLLFERGQRFAMAVADLDHFKGLNDTYGHEMGDRALRQFAEVLRTTTRVDDIVARWGGEEFTIVFPSLSALDAASICERVREGLALACAAAKMPTFTVSFGVVESAAGNDMGEIFKIADEALYAAKDSGRNRTIIGPISAASTITADRHAVEHPAAMDTISTDL